MSYIHNRIIVSSPDALHLLVRGPGPDLHKLRAALPVLDTGRCPHVLPQRQKVGDVLILVPLGEAGHGPRHLVARVDALLKAELLRHHEQPPLPHAAHVPLQVQSLRHGSVPR